MPKLCPRLGKGQAGRGDKRDQQPGRDAEPATTWPPGSLGVPPQHSNSTSHHSLPQSPSPCPFPPCVLTPSPLLHSFHLPSLPNFISPPFLTSSPLPSSPHLSSFCCWATPSPSFLILSFPLSPTLSLPHFPSSNPMAPSTPSPISSQSPLSHTSLLCTSCPVSPGRKRVAMETPASRGPLSYSPWGSVHSAGPCVSRLRALPRPFLCHQALHRHLELPPPPLHPQITPSPPPLPGAQMGLGDGNVGARLRVCRSGGFRRRPPPQPRPPRASGGDTVAEASEFGGRGCLSRDAGLCGC